jgi:predicted nucleotidyltransferase
MNNGAFLGAADRIGIRFRQGEHDLGSASARARRARTLARKFTKAYHHVMDAAAILTDEEVRTTLTSLKERLRSLLGSAMLKLMLFGSRARGDADPDSDVDIAIIVRGCDSRMKDRILNTVAAVELEQGVPLSTLVLSEEDYERLLERERRIALDIEREGMEL